MGIRMKDISEIPKGQYCYTGFGVEKREDGSIRLKTKKCPYWSSREDKPEQQNGYCSYLERGDWDAIIPEDFPEGFPVSVLSLLWDQVKEPDCPVPVEDEDYDEID